MPAATSDLAVRFGARDVGRLRGGRDDLLRFEYAPEWLALDTAFPVSVSLPLRETEYIGGAAHAFFANLLPEGGVREAVCRRLGISESNDLALLRAIGGECAGALTLVDATATGPTSSEHEYEELDDRRLRSLISDDQVVPLLVGGTTTRLSLAGAQDKLPVAMLDGRIHLPLAGSPSTHILKLPHHRYAHLPANEAYVTGLAARLGFDVVTVTLFHRTGAPSLLVERYDRVTSDDPWPAVRLHQEDLCQALGLPPSRKYEQEGGPSLAAVIDLVRSQVRRPVVEVARLVEWQAFNVAVGNSDGHGKNLSILYEEGGPRLTPFYDLVSTRHYDGLDPLLAMGVGGNRNPDQLADTHWAALAAELGISGRVVTSLVRAVAERCLETLDEWTREFREQSGEQSILQTLPRAIGKRARRLRKSLS